MNNLVKPSLVSYFEDNPNEDFSSLDLRSFDVNLCNKLHHNALTYYIKEISEERCQLKKNLTIAQLDYIVYNTNYNAENYKVSHPMWVANVEYEHLTKEQKLYILEKSDLTCSIYYEDYGETHSLLDSVFESYLISEYPEKKLDLFVERIVQRSNLSKKNLFYRTPLLVAVADPYFKKLDPELVSLLIEESIKQNSIEYALYFSLKRKCESWCRIWHCAKNKEKIIDVIQKNQNLHDLLTKDELLSYIEKKSLEKEIFMHKKNSLNKI